MHNKIREVVPALGYDGTVALLDRLHRYEATLSRINDNDANGHLDFVSAARYYGTMVH